MEALSDQELEAILSEVTSYLQTKGFNHGQIFVQQDLEDGTTWEKAFGFGNMNARIEFASSWSRNKRAEYTQDHVNRVLGMNQNDR